MASAKHIALGLLAVFGLSACSSDTITSAVTQQVLAESGSFQYATYTQDAFDDLKGSAAFTVFVHSKSCGTCAGKNNQIIDEVTSFDDGTILKMEYSEAPQAFLTEYGVTKYDTFVQFAADGSHTTVKGASIADVRSGL